MGMFFLCHFCDGQYICSHWYSEEVSECMHGRNILSKFLSAALLHILR